MQRLLSIIQVHGKARVSQVFPTGLQKTCMQKQEQLRQYFSPGSNPHPFQPIQPSYMEYLLIFLCYDKY